MQNDFFNIQIEDGIATIWLDFKKEKMNIVSPSLIGNFNEVFELLNNDSNIKGGIIISAKPDFIAGADIKSFNAEKEGDFKPISIKGHDILSVIEKSKKPIVAAIHGTCYGLGTEMSLACHGRICSDDKKTKLALPEVKLGLLPGGGGTQRLPRLIGLQKSLDMMLTGKNIYPRQAKKMGLVDEVVNKNKLHKAAVKMINKIIENGPLPRKIKKSLLNKILDHTLLGRKIVFKKAREKVLKMTQGNYPAPIEIINCVEIGLNQGLVKGYEAEVERFEKLMLSDVSKALRNIFFNMTDKKKNPYNSAPKKLDRIAVLGDGFMGAGIADVSINNGVDVILKDLDEKIVSSAKKGIWKNINRKIKKRQITKIEGKTIIQKAVGQTGFNGFSNVNIVIEAIIENMEIKKKGDPRAGNSLQRGFHFCF